MNEAAIASSKQFNSQNHGPQNAVSQITTDERNEEAQKRFDAARGEAVKSHQTSEFTFYQSQRHSQHHFASQTTSQHAVSAIVTPMLSNTNSLCPTPPNMCVQDHACQNMPNFYSAGGIGDANPISMINNVSLVQCQEPPESPSWQDNANNDKESAKAPVVPTT